IIQWICSMKSTIPRAGSGRIRISSARKTTGSKISTGNGKNRNSSLLSSFQIHMEGNPTQFEAIGNRLGFRILEETDKKLSLVWQGPRFPAFLCLGIALLLLSVSLPILYAIHLNGFVGDAGSLWYFPLMNLILFGISFYLLSQKRTIIIDTSAQQITLKKRSLYQTTLLSLAYLEIQRL